MWVGRFSRRIFNFSYFFEGCWCFWVIDYTNDKAPHFV